MENYLYHFTATYHVNSILSCGYLELCPSNLIEPKDLKHGIDPLTGNPSMVSEMSDSYKPVVWLVNMDQIASNEVRGHGLSEFKVVVRCKIPMKDDYQWWSAWADKNRMKTSWRKRFTRNTRYSAWYVCEHRIPLEDIEIIENLESGEIYWDSKTGEKNPIGINIE